MRWLPWAIWLALVALIFYIVAGCQRVNINVGGGSPKDAIIIIEPHVEKEKKDAK